MKKKYSFKFNEDYELSSKIIDGKFDEWVYGKVLLNEKSNTEVNVFYNFYKPENFDRYGEIIYCFNRLLKNKNIDNLYVLCSNDLLIEDEKLIKIKIDGQPRYRDFFNIIDFYTNESDINIILNSDCYIDETGIDLIKNNISEDDAYVLSRWDILEIKPLKIKHFNKVYNNDQGVSQDAWIFIGHPKKELDGDYKMGMAGCDNSIAYEFYTSGYKISNPSFSIKIYHYHLTNIRTYGDYGTNFDNRSEHRIQLPHKFVPSSFLPIEKIEDGMNIIFYNHYHNGDIHYSREFIKDIMKKYKAKSFSYFYNFEQVGSENIIKDVNLSNRKDIPFQVSEKDSMVLINDNMFINTWVGQKDYKFVNEIGINLKANYEIYEEVYRILNIDIEEDMEYYIPTINYKYFEIDNCDIFLKKHKINLKVLISNGIVKSNQCKNFDMNESIEEISNKYPDIIFILTDSKNRLKGKNIFYTDDIIGQKFDLNEISYLSLSCDMIIGKSSGPYAFSMVKENLLNDKKTIICLSNKEENEWYISETCKHIISNEYEKKDLVKLISNEIDSIKEKKPRIAFTIILNGLHHLKHNDYAEYLTGIFDYWVIVEGAVENKGSTSWCKKMPKNYHKNGESVDGTIEFIENLCKEHNNVIFVKSNGVWKSKDDMVNKAIDEVKKITNNCLLWEIDIDEQWTYNQIIKSEKEFIKDGSKTGEFNVFQFVGENLVTEGKDWSGNPFRRLWNWNGEYFEKHEPPILKTDDKSVVLLSEKMKHYSFYFEQDVKFKNDWYTNHEGVYDNWIKLKDEKEFPQHITYLFPNFKGSGLLKNSENLDCRIVRYNELNTKNNIKSDTTRFHKENILSKFVDEVYCINLIRREDRKKHILDQFKKIGLGSFKIIKGIDGQKLKITETEKRKAEIGCLRSHISVIQDAINRGYNKIAIFEDDVIFCDDFEKRFEYYSNYVPDNWDIMYLGSDIPPLLRPVAYVKNMIFRVWRSTGCYAMILNNKNGLFQKIIDESKTEKRPIDIYIENLFPKINAYTFLPSFVKLLETKSDISDKNLTFLNSRFKEIL
jgi:GR25 family glycosyltransferase involved in LPS biosynthesis